MSMKRKLSFSALACLGAATVVLCTPRLSAQSAHASEKPEVDLAITYSAQHSNTVPGSNFWMQGGGAELSASFHNGIGAVADVTGEYASKISSGTGLSLVTETFGPRYTWRTGARHTRRIALFGQALIGEAIGFNSTFVNPVQGVQQSWNSFALRTGGGVDFDLSRHIAVRAVQADWLRTQFPNSTTNIQNNVRIGAGIVIHLQR